MRSAEQQIHEAITKANSEDIRNTVSQMPIYRSVKPAKAACIAEVKALPGHEALMVTIPGTDGVHRLPVDALWLQRYRPESGGWVLTYGDGFPWYVPAHLFVIDFVQVGVRFIDMVRDFCRNSQVDGYTDDLPDQQVMAGLPSDVINDLALRFTVMKVEQL